MKILNIKVNLMMLFVCFLLLNTSGFAQEEYKATAKDPFGTLNPAAAKQLADYSELIGDNICKSTQRDSTGKFKKPVRALWRFKYIMNGTAIQDETWKADGTHTSSIRQFDVKNSTWRVTFFSSGSASVKPPVWSGGKTENGDIVLKKPQKAPNGMDGFSRLTFYEISKVGFKWRGEWVDTSEKVKFPFWTIECKKKRV